MSMVISTRELDQTTGSERGSQASQCDARSWGSERLMISPDVRLYSNVWQQVIRAQPCVVEDN